MAEIRNLTNPTFGSWFPRSKSIKDSLRYSTGNAKSETIFELKSFKEPILSSRSIFHVTQFSNLSDRLDPNDCMLSG